MSTVTAASAPAAPDDSAQQALLEAYFRSSTSTLLAGAFGAALVGALLWPHLPTPLVATWLVAIQALFLLRLLSVRVFMALGWRLASPRAWRRFAVLATTLQGSAWGAFGLTVAVLNDPLLQAVVLVTVLVLVAGSAALVGALPTVVPMFGMMAIAPTVVGLLTWGDRVHAFLAFACTMGLLTVSFALPRTVQRLVARVHQAGQAREQLLTHLEDAEQMARVGHFVYEVALGRVEMSPQAQRLFGSERLDWRGLEAFCDAVVAKERAQVREQVAQVLAGRCAEQRFETQLLTPTGHHHLQVVMRADRPSGWAPDEGEAVEAPVQRVMVTVVDISAQKATERELSELAYGDPLTGLANRSAFQRMLQEAIAGTRHQQDRMLALLLLDLDHFKAVNDTLGHAAGDRLLVQAAERLRTRLRSSDGLARLGGDEFAIILSDLSGREQAEQVASGLIEALGRPFQLDGGETYISSSIGIALCPDDATTAEALLGCADVAMFDAKSRGRAGYRFHRAELSEQARQRARLDGDLRRAIERNELELHYQPKVRLADGRLAGAEALLRWRHHELGMVSPDRFVPVAEESGLIVPIGDWVLRSACIAARDWNLALPAGAPSLKIAVNLSPRQFWVPGFVDTVRAALRDTGCRSEWIELEMTESLLIDSRGQVGETLAELRALGFTLAIDDFGTGYSALGYLTRFPITTLKIDRSFVSDMTNQPAHAGIVRAVVAMGHSLGLELVAEGVETAEQAQALDALHCAYAQGWHFGRPMPRERFESVYQLAPAVSAGAATLTA